MWLVWVSFGGVLFSFFFFKFFLREDLGVWMDGRERVGVVLGKYGLIRACVCCRMELLPKLREQSRGQG